MSNNIRSKTNRSAFLILFVFCVLLPGMARAEEIAGSKSSPAGSRETGVDQPENISVKYKDYFSGAFRILGYGIVQEPTESTQNPGNNILRVPRYSTVLELRPDLGFNSRYLELSAKPRAKFDFRSWQDGDLNGETEWRDDWYVNEWLVRLKAADRIFASYGRENLQWGPSFLYSPSNPFFSDNGRSNPYLEVPGMDFFRLVVVPHSLWTISFIVNTDEGRNILLGPDPFEKTYAVKLDYTGRQNYASLIFSEKDSHGTLGFFGGWTATDALLLYGEGSLSKGSRALYPVANVSILDAMQKIHEDDPDVKPVLLAGGSYTFENSGTLTLEYLYNAPGYSKDEADLYYQIRRDAADLFNMGGIGESIGSLVLSQTGNPGLRFLRKNYVMLQYYQGNIRNKADVTLRWTQNIDDGSGQFLGLFSYAIGDRWELFTSGVVNEGKGNTEFGSVLNYQVMLGLKFSI